MAISDDDMIDAWQSYTVFALKERYTYQDVNNSYQMARRIFSVRLKAKQSAPQVQPEGHG